jgi:hypothetical protein
MVIVLAATYDHDAADMYGRREPRHDDDLRVSITDQFRLSSEATSERLEDTDGISGLCDIECSG